MQIDILGPPPIASSGNGGGRGASRQRGGLALDLPSHRSPVGRNRCGLFVKHLLLILFSLILAIFGGGMINRIRGGFLNLPEFANGTDVNAYNVVFRDFVARSLWSLSTGVLVGGSMLETKKSDPYYLRRISAGFLVSVATFASILTGWGTYFSVGHNPNAYTDRIGVFDGLIGHQCQGWDEWQLTLHELSGMSLRGLVQTLPAGFILFAFGYGLEYMLSGILMGAIYSVGWAIPFPAGPFGQGIAFSELIWGAWTWGVLFYVIMTYRERPISTPARTIHGRRTSIARKIFFYAFLLLVDSILIAACATFGQTTQSDMVNMYQTWIGILASTSIFIGAQVIVLGLVPLFRWCCRPARDDGADSDWEALNTDASATDDDRGFSTASKEYSSLLATENDGLLAYPYRAGGRLINESSSSRRSAYNIDDDSDGCCGSFARGLKVAIVPEGNAPWRWILLLIRFVCVVDAFMNLALFAYVVAVQRFGPESCPIPWHS